MRERKKVSVRDEIFIAIVFISKQTTSLFIFYFHWNFLISNERNFADNKKKTKKKILYGE